MVVVAVAAEADNAEMETKEKGTVREIQDTRVQSLKAILTWITNNTWYNLMAQKQADSVNKLCAEKARSAAALGQKQDASDDDASVASTAKNDGAQFGREGKKGKRKRG